MFSEILGPSEVVKVGLGLLIAWGDFSIPGSVPLTGRRHTFCFLFWCQEDENEEPNIDTQELQAGPSSQVCYSFWSFFSC